MASLFTAITASGAAALLGIWLAEPEWVAWARQKFAAWREHRTRARRYHRARYARTRCHARPTLAHRARVQARRAMTVRLRARVDPDATTPMSAVATIPDPAQFVRTA